MKTARERKERYFPTDFLISIFFFLDFEYILISPLFGTLDSQLEFDMTLLSPFYR